MYKKLNTKLHNLEDKTPDVSTLVQTNKHDTDKKNSRKNFEMFIENT